MTWRLALAVIPVLLAPAAAGAQVPVCVPPAEPWVPESEADFREYVDMVAADFERYFTELTRYFQCLEQGWQDGIERGRSVSAARKAFVARARALGLDARLGVDPPPARGRPE